MKNSLMCQCTPTHVCRYCKAVRTRRAKQAELERRAAAHDELVTSHERIISLIDQPDIPMAKVLIAIRAISDLAIAKAKQIGADNDAD